MVVFTLRRLVFRHSSLLTRGPPFWIVDLRVKCVLVWRSYGEVRLHWVRVVEPELEQQTQTEPVMPGSAALVCVTLFFFYFFYYKSGESVTHKHTTYTRTHTHLQNQVLRVYHPTHILTSSTCHGPTATKRYLITRSYRCQVEVVIDLYERDVEFGNLENAGRLVSGGIQFLQF